MNFSYLNINNPTDVISLSFLSSTSDNFIGDIFISPEVVIENANKYGCSFDDEMKRSFVHGVLHLLGYSHKGTLNHSEEMFKIQESILDLSQ
jgi:probable rRNA maturation factor